jgi:hypothetical protein
VGRVAPPRRLTRAGILFFFALYKRQIRLGHPS